MKDRWIEEFLQHLRAVRAASPYTERNYRQALCGFHRWHQCDRGQPPRWPDLQRDDFRAYLRFLGRSNLSRASTQLRFSALRSFYKYLIRRGLVATSPIRELAMPKMGRRLPRFLTAQQMLDLLNAPLKELAQLEQSGAKSIDRFGLLRDAAVLETIYSCGLRVSELCGLQAEDIQAAEQVVRVRGKGRKERLVPIGAPALEAIRRYWKSLDSPPAAISPVFCADEKKQTPMYPAWFSCG